jgi:hypothetical protein
VRPPSGPRRVLGRARGRVDGGHPEGLTFEEAAPSSEGSHYARSSIRAAKVRRGQDVLVYGATSAIGSAAVQLLKQVGATSRLPARRATRVPYRRVNHGTERTTTVTATPALSWRLALLLLQRIPGMCLIRRSFRSRPGSSCQPRMQRTRPEGWVDRSGRRLHLELVGQLADLGFRVAAVPTKGLQERQPAFFGPAGHGLG